MSEENEKELIRPPPKTIVHRCTTCFRELENEHFALCIKCKGFIQCLPCLSEGIEKGSHIREHPFIIVPPTLSSLFRTDWSAEEEALFLDAIQNCGLGNYQDMENLLKFKSAREYESHYISTYSCSPFAPRPEQEILGPDEPTPEPDFDTAPVPSNPADNHEDNLRLIGKEKPDTPGEIAGFMPRRVEYDCEYRDSAELLICDLTIDENTTPTDFQEMLNKLHAYDSVVEEREKRIKIAIDFGLNKKEYRPQIGPSDEDQEAAAKLLPLAPYIGKQNVEELLKMISDKIKFNSLINTRNKWQAQGVRSLQEGNLLYELERLIQNGKLPSSAIDKWNERIEEFKKNIDPSDTPLLDKVEADLCRKEKIPNPLYLSLKDLVIREFAIRGSLSRNECCELDPKNSDFLGKMYDLYIDIGWICE